MFSVEGATLEPPRDEVMYALSLYYMHGFQNMHWVCTNRVCDEAVGTPAQSRREEGITIPAGVVDHPTIIGLRGSEKGDGDGNGNGNCDFQNQDLEYNCKSSAHHRHRRS